MINKTTSSCDKLKAPHPITLNNEHIKYFKKIAQYPRLTAKEEIDLATRAKKGDKAAFDKLVNCNLRLVIAPAKKYCFAGMDMFDLIQAGNVGLITAAKNYDPSRGNRFSTYATWLIKTECYKYVAEMSNAISLDNHVMYWFQKIKKVIENDLHLDLADITDADLRKASEAIKMTPSRVKSIINACLPYTSLYTAVVENEEYTIADIIPDEATPSIEDTVVFNELSKELSGIIKSLPQKERVVIKSRFGFTDGKPRKLREVGSQLNISKQRVQQIETKAIESIKKGLDKKYDKKHPLI